MPDWFAKLVIAVMATVGTGLGTWALSSTQGHEGRIIRLETEQTGMKDMLKEIRSDIKDVKERLERRSP